MLELTYQYLQHSKHSLGLNQSLELLLPDQCGACQVYHHTHYHQGGKEGHYKTHLKANERSNQKYE